MTIHSRPDPIITRYMINASPTFDWARDGVPNEMVAFLWGKLEGKRGCELPIEKMVNRGITLSVMCSEPLTHDDKVTIRGMWSAIIQAHPVVLFSDPSTGV